MPGNLFALLLTFFALRAGSEPPSGITGDTGDTGPGLEPNG